MISKSALATELADRVENQTGQPVSKRVATTMLESLAMICEEELVERGEITIPKIVKLKAVDRKARQARNPATGGTVQVPARRVIKAKAVAALEKTLNGE